MEEIIGRLSVVIFHNEENLYSVIKVRVSDISNEKYITLTGNFPIPNDNCDYKFCGEYVKHPRFGLQFVVSKYEEILPNSKDSIIKYLSSPIFPKIGVRTATKIYNALGEQSISIIKSNSDVLDDILSKEQKQIILDGLGSGTYFDEAVRLFVTQGLSIKMLAKIQSVYKENMIDIIKNNPYQLIEDVDGIGFKTADELARNLGFDLYDEKRIKACIIYCASNICFNESDTYTNEDRIMIEFDKIIGGVDEKSKHYYFELLISEGKLFKEQEKIFPMSQFIGELDNARILSLFIKKIINDMDAKEINRIIGMIEEKLHIKYDDTQREAIMTCLNSGITIITGGPGTGKTTIVNAIIQVYKELIHDSQIHICAPTGRASKRLTDITGVKSTTIHSLLRWDLHSNTFSVNEKNPLIGNLLIVDEFSMVDNYLLHQLLRASQNIGQIIFIGDEDQLPSVGPGNVLRDLLDSNVINTIRLNKIYRQSESSNIIKLAHHIKNNQNIQEDFEDDVTFYSANDFSIKKVVLEYIKKAKNNGYENDDIQVLAPMYQGINGIDNFNDLLQDYFNPSDDFLNEMRIGKSIYRENDKILQLKNQNEDNVYNGDIGKLIEIENKDNSKLAKMYVDYDGNVVEYTNKDFINITHAYCISIHKSQGSEYPLIILPVCFAYQRMLVKNLLYTAITRAKQKLVIVGNYDAFLYGINNTNYKIRKTTLKDKLLKFVNPL